jgi:hypothetical protein
MIEAGILPLEMILATGRRMWADAVDANGNIVSLKLAKKAATFCAPALPYTSSRLQALAHSVVPGNQNTAVEAANRARELAAQMIQEAKTEILLRQQKRELAG